MISFPIKKTERRLSMKISDILSSGKTTLSFEVFPPKTDSSLESVKWAAMEIASLRPSFMSITYGAGGGTSDFTIEIAKVINEYMNVPAISHLTCLSSDEETIKARINDILNAGLDNVMALRGDIPKDMTPEDLATRPYKHAVELIGEIKKYGAQLCIGGACYPETHPEAVSSEADLEYLKMKQDAGCEFFTTQMFFSNELFYDFVDRARKIGITIPIVAGIMPITNLKQAKRSVEMSGSFFPERLNAYVEKFGNDYLSMKQAGINYAIEQITDLYAHGVKNIHVYSMNKPDVARTISEAVSPMVGKKYE